jgi:hypothetical protein
VIEGESSAGDAARALIERAGVLIANFASARSIGSAFCMNDARAWPATQMVSAAGKATGERLETAVFPFGKPPDRVRKPLKCRHTLHLRQSRFTGVM